MLHDCRPATENCRKTIGLKQSAEAIVVRKSDYRPIR